MTPAARARHEKALRAALTELNRSGPSRVEPNRTSDSQVGADEDAQPLNEMLQAVASGRNRNRAQLAAQVARALSRLRDEPDEYGLCEECGEEIARARLAAMPWASLCVACQAVRDGPRQGPTRRRLTDYR